jgi:hypothetical protein
VDTSRSLERQYQEEERLGCAEKSRLLADYAERVQALAVQAELILDSLEKEWEEGGSHRWHRMEQARIKCDIAHLALSIHTSDHGC